MVPERKEEEEVVEEAMGVVEHTEEERIGWVVGWKGMEVEEKKETRFRF